MTEKNCNIAAQYFKAVFARAELRPYEVKGALSNAIAVEIRVDVTVEGTNAEGALCFEAGASIEAIVVESGNLEEDELAFMLHQQIPGLLLGNVRAAISSATMETGYGPVVLPPLSGTQLEQIAKKG